MVKTQILAAVALGASAVSSSQSHCPYTNLVQNPSFETGAFAPWNNISMEQEVIKGDAYNGSYFARFLTNVVPPGGEPNNVYSISQNFTGASPGDPHQAQVAWRVLNGIGSYCDIGIVINDEPNWLATANTTNQSTSWNVLSAVYSPPEVNNTITIISACDYGSANLTVDLDAVAFYNLKVYCNPPK